MSTEPRNHVLEQVLDDLAAEGEALELLVAPLDRAAWRTPTPAAGWDVATQIAHLAWTDEVAVAAATDEEAWGAHVALAAADPTGFVDRQALAGAQGDPAELLDRWRSARVALRRALRELPVGTRMPWFGPPMSATSMATARFMETWAHSLDVAEALGISPEPDDRIRHVAHLGVRTRNFSFAMSSLEVPPADFRVELSSPTGEQWAWGPPDAAQSVRGPAYDFCLLVTRRRHRDDLALVAVGADADQWLDIAQAFAGPPGQGREARADG